jgi:hypothetical protein
MVNRREERSLLHRVSFIYFDATHRGMSEASVSGFDTRWRRRNPKVRFSHGCSVWTVVVAVGCSGVLSAGGARSSRSEAPEPRTYVRE